MNQLCSNSDWNEEPNQIPNPLFPPLLLLSRRHSAAMTISRLAAIATMSALLVLASSYGTVRCISDIELTKAAESSGSGQGTMIDNSETSLASCSGLQCRGCGPGCYDCSGMDLRTANCSFPTDAMIM